KHSGGNGWDTELVGVHETLPKNDSAAPERRAFHYDGGFPMLRFVRPVAPSAPRGGSTLTLSPSRQSELVAQYTFYVLGWSEPNLPIRLPPQATLLHSEVNGRAERLAFGADGHLQI